MLSVFAIHSFSVLAGLVELLSLDVELLLVADDGLVEGNVVGVVEDWWRFGVSYGNQKQNQANLGRHGCKRWRFITIKTI